MGDNSIPQGQPRWEREEQVLLVAEYYTHKDDVKSLKTSCIYLSELLNRRGKVLELDVGEKFRNVNGIMRQMENLSHCDDKTGEDINGHESKWMFDIINEYKSDPDKILAEAYKIIRKYS